MSSYETPNTLGERVHSDMDWVALHKDYQSRPRTTAESIEFFCNHLPSAGNIAAVLSNKYTLEIVETIRRDIENIFAAPVNRKKTGKDLNLLGLPGVLCPSPLHLLVANSTTLTPRDLQEVQEMPQGKAGTLGIHFMSIPTGPSNFAGLHVEAMIIPYDENQPMLLSTALAYTEAANPNSRRWIQDRFGVKDLGLKPVSEAFSALFTAAKDNSKLGFPNVVLPLRRGDWDLSCMETMALEKSGYELPSENAPVQRNVFHTECVAVFNLSFVGQQKMLQVEELSHRSVARGELLTMGIHTGSNSCGAFAMAMLAYAMPQYFNDRDLWSTSIDKLAYTAIDKAETVYMPENNMDTRIYDFVHPTNFHDYFVEVEVEVAKAKLAGVFGAKDIWKVFIPGWSSYGNTYLRFSEEHPVKEASEMYAECLKVVADEIRGRVERVIGEMQV